LDEITVTDDGAGGVVLGIEETDPCAMPYLDQEVKTTSSPTFVSINLTGTPSIDFPANFDLTADSNRVFRLYDPNGNLFIGAGTATESEGSYNLFFGYQAGLNNEYAEMFGFGYQGTRNVYIGYQAGRGGVDNTGIDNVAIGYQSLYSNTTGSINTAIGKYTLYSNTTGNSNFGCGTSALYSNTTGTYNTALGESALYTNDIGGFNTAIGAGALYAMDPATGAQGINNTAVGYGAGYLLTTGSSNVFLGYLAGWRQTTNSNLLIIDNMDRGSAANELANSLIYGVFGAAAANQSLRINADAITFNGGTNSDIVFTYTGTTKSGSMSWMEDEDYFKYSDDILMNSTEKIYLRDTALGIYSQADTFLDLFADGGVRIGDSSAGAPTNYVQFAPTSNMTFAGTASFNLPTSAAPTLDAAGELAHDTTVSGLANGCLSYYDGTAIQYLVDLTTLPSDDDYIIAYDADADGFYMKQDAWGFSWSSAPDKPTDSGTAGDIAYDSTNLYVCVATNTWKRTALSTWQNVILLETGDKVLLEDSANMAEE